MAMVTMTAEAAKQASRLPRPIRARLIDLVERLEKWPDAKLHTIVAGTNAVVAGKISSKRFGAAHVDKENVIIVKVGHRDGFYEE